LKENIKLSAGLFRGGMLQSFAILYAEHALARKIKYDKIFIDFADKIPVDRRLSTAVVPNRGAAAP